MLLEKEKANIEPPSLTSVFPCNLLLVVVHGSYEALPASLGL